MGPRPIHLCASLVGRWMDVGIYMYINNICGSTPPPSFISSAHTRTIDRPYPQSIPGRLHMLEQGQQHQRALRPHRLPARGGQRGDLQVFHHPAAPVPIAGWMCVCICAEGVVIRWRRESVYRDDIRGVLERKKQSRGNDKQRKQATNAKVVMTGPLALAPARRLFYVGLLFTLLFYSCLLPTARLLCLLLTHPSICPVADSLGPSLLLEQFSYTPLYVPPYTRVSASTSHRGHRGSNRPRKSNRCRKSCASTRSGHTSETQASPQNAILRPVVGSRSSWPAVPPQHGCVCVCV